jgi:ubiquinone/menaquinone biosynthesis C-methylase UbiE
MERVISNSSKGFWVLSKLGKKVLRPGGKELTKKIIDELFIQPNYKLVEFAPGKGLTTAMLLQEKPKEYFGIDIEAETIVKLQKKFSLPNSHFIQSSASETKLESQFSDVVIGEAMLTMNADHRKAEIIAEAFRLLKPGGLYAIHELGLVPENIDENSKKEILIHLSKAGKVNARPLTQIEWEEVLKKQGFLVKKVIVAPMLLLQFKRLISDEGWFGLMKIFTNLLLQPTLRNHVLMMKKAFEKYATNLVSIAIIAEKPLVDKIENIL